MTSPGSAVLAVGKERMRRRAVASNQGGSSSTRTRLRSGALATPLNPGAQAEQGALLSPGIFPPAPTAGSCCNPPLILPCWPSSCCRLSPKKVVTLSCFIRPAKS